MSLFSWAKSLLSRPVVLEDQILRLMRVDGYVTKDSFFELTGMKLYWLQKCAQTMTQKGYTVKQVRSTLEKHPGHLGGCQVRWYFTK